MSVVGRVQRGFNTVKDTHPLVSKQFGFAVHSHTRTCTDTHTQLIDLEMSLFHIAWCFQVCAASVCLASQEEMENKAMYLSTYEERENGSVYEDTYDGHNLSKLNLCEEGEQTAQEQRETQCSDLCLMHLNYVQFFRLTIFFLIIIIFLWVYDCSNTVLVCSPQQNLWSAGVATWHRKAEIYKQH